MKTCNEFQAKLSAYLDGEAGDQEEMIRTHLASCGTCGKTLDGLKNLSSQIRGVEEKPAALVDDILRRIRHKGQLPIGIRKLAAVAAILAAILWAAVLLSTKADSPIRLSGLVPSGALSDSEQRILYGKPLSADEWMIITLKGGGPR